MKGRAKGPGRRHKGCERTFKYNRSVSQNDCNVRGSFAKCNGKDFLLDLQQTVQLSVVRHTGYAPNVINKTHTPFTHTLHWAQYTRSFPTPCCQMKLPPPPPPLSGRLLATVENRNCLVSRLVLSDEFFPSAHSLVRARHGHAEWCVRTRQAESSGIAQDQRCEQVWLLNFPLASL